MVTDRVRIDGLAAGRARLAQGDLASRSVLVVTVTRRVPDWLDELVAAASEVGASVLVEAVPPTHLVGPERDGWEIGVCTTALGAGAADVAGVAPQRVARVREITARLAEPAPMPAPEAAP
ncbi:MAG TPA: hypothetical protein VNS19_03035 [Acidimicrobiales bacterium]|nr:hypothetical protein [Acidimicrobiales bacterium]